MNDKAFFVLDKLEKAVSDSDSKSRINDIKISYAARKRKKSERRRNKLRNAYAYMIEAYGFLLEKLNDFAGGDLSQIDLKMMIRAALSAYKNAEIILKEFDLQDDFPQKWKDDSEKIKRRILEDGWLEIEIPKGF